MTPTALVHTALGTLALASGALVLLRRKGDRWHRRVGRVYGVSMAALCLLSFGLRDSTPFFRGLGGFHVAAVVSLGTLALGLWAVRRRGSKWLDSHFQFMAWSYIGLVMATGGHVMRPLFVLLRDAGLPGTLAIALSVGVVWGVPPALGAWWIARRASAWRGLGRGVPAEAA